MTSNSIRVQDPKCVKDPELNADNLDLFKNAQTAVAAGLAYTAKRYIQIDNDKTPVNKEKGTFSYDTGDKSVFYH